MALILWTFVSPLGVIALVGGRASVRRFVARNYLICVCPGWLAAAAMVYGTLALRGTTQVVVLAAAAPLTGLAIWVRERRYELDDPFEAAPPPSPPPARERKKPQPSLVPADCEWRTRAPAARATSRPGAITLPSRTRSNA